MRKNGITVFLLFLTSVLFGQNQVGLQEAVDKFAKELTSRLHGNETIAVVGFKTDNHVHMVTFFDTMIEKIMEHDRNAVIVERQRIENLQKELDFSLTGLVSDNTAQRIGHFIGADIVIYGELISGERRNNYRMTIRATMTETGVILLSKNYDLRIGYNPDFWSIGASVGTAFIKPWLIGTVRGTLAPFQHSFLELGLDLGTISGKTNVDYFSIYPYVNYAYFLPFDKGGWYIGAGIGYLWSVESQPDFIYRYRIIAMNIMTGFIIANMFDISYTMRTNFEGISNKFSIGYIYRFQ